jgi:hypothetical protein
MELVGFPFGVIKIDKSEEMLRWKGHHWKSGIEDGFIFAESWSEAVFKGFWS